MSNLTKKIILVLCIFTSDEPEPSSLEPWLELKDFQLGSAWLVTFFSSARNQKLTEKQAEISILSGRPIFYYFQ